MQQFAMDLFVREIENLLDSRIEIITRINEYYENVLRNYDKLGQIQKLGICQREQQQLQQQRQQQQRLEKNRSLIDSKRKASTSKKSSTEATEQDQLEESNERKLPQSLSEILEKASAIRQQHKAAKASKEKSKRTGKQAVGSDLNNPIRSRDESDLSSLSKLTIDLETRSNERHQHSRLDTDEVSVIETKDILYNEEYAGAVIQSLKQLKPNQSLGEACSFSFKEFYKLAKLQSSSCGYTCYPTSIPYQLMNVSSSSSSSSTISSACSFAALENIISDFDCVFTSLQELIQTENENEDEIKAENENLHIRKLKKFTFHLMNNSIVDLTVVAKKVLESIAYIQSVYEKTLSSRLSRISVGQLSRDDVMDVVYMWFKLQRLYSIYQKLVEVKQFHTAFQHPGSHSSSSALEGDITTSATAAATAIPSTTTKSMQGTKQSRESSINLEMRLLLNQFKSQPVMTALTGLSRLSQSKAVLNKVKTEEWLQYHTEIVKAHHETLSNEIKYAIETMAGKALIKELIGELRDCCQMESIANETSQNISTAVNNTSRLSTPVGSSARASSSHCSNSTSGKRGASSRPTTATGCQQADSQEDRWKRTLMKYRDTYCALVDECQRFDAVYFMVPGPTQPSTT